jgi:hypothetical protein
MTQIPMFSFAFIRVNSRLILVLHATPRQLARIAILT